MLGPTTLACWPSSRSDSRRTLARTPFGPSRARASRSARPRADRPAGQSHPADRGLATAESAIGEDDADAAAHFAVFCNLGRQLQLRSIGFLTFFDVRRLRREIDRTLELAPHSPGVLTAKGVLLLRLPRLLGGDTSEGERLIRRALEVAPGFAPAEEALRASDGKPAASESGP